MLQIYSCFRFSQTYFYNVCSATCPAIFILLSKLCCFESMFSCSRIVFTGYRINKPSISLSVHLHISVVTELPGTDSSECICPVRNFQLCILHSLHTIVPGTITPWEFSWGRNTTLKLNIDHSSYSRKAQSSSKCYWWKCWRSYNF